MLEFRKISRGYQVTLPHAFREKFHLEIGDLLEFIEKEDELIIKPLKARTRENAAIQLINFLELSGDVINDMSEEEILSLAHKIKKELK